MVVLYILGILAALIILLMFVPVGADVAYENGEFSLSAKVCGIAIQILPRPPADGQKEKPEKPKKEKKKKAETDTEAEEKPKKKRSLPFNKDEILALAKLAVKSLGKFGKVGVDRFMLHFISAGDDPYNTVMTYNYANAALSALAPLCRESFIVKSSDVWTDIDFMAEKPMIDFGLGIFIRIGQVFRVAFALLFGAIGILIKNRIRLRRERKAAAAEKTAELPENQEEIIKDNTQENERMN